MSSSTNFPVSPLLIDEPPREFVIISWFYQILYYIKYCYIKYGIISNMMLYQILCYIKYYVISNIILSNIRLYGKFFLRGTKMVPHFVILFI